MCKPTDQEHKIKKAIVFLKRHESCLEGVEVSLDVVPDVIRLDCNSCHVNIQIPYDAQLHS